MQQDDRMVDSGRRTTAREPGECSAGAAGLWHPQARRPLRPEAAARLIRMPCVCVSPGVYGAYRISGD